MKSDASPHKKTENWFLLGRLEVKNFMGMVSKHVKSLGASIKHNRSVYLASVVSYF